MQHVVVVDHDQTSFCVSLQSAHLFWQKLKLAGMRSPVSMYLLDWRKACRKNTCDELLQEDHDAQPADCLTA